MPGPPYSGAKPPERSCVRLTMSALKTEMIPSMWKGLKMGTPSSRTRFWSAEPPRTLKEAPISDTRVTPGSASTVRTGSASAAPGMDRTPARSISMGGARRRLPEARPGRAR